MREWLARIAEAFSKTGKRKASYFWQNSKLQGQNNIVSWATMIAKHWLFCYDTEYV